MERVDGFIFHTYPDCLNCLPNFNDYLILDLGGTPLSKEDHPYGLILIDATWRLATKMLSQLHALEGIPRRSIPPGFQTAYPRRQQDCTDPMAGLASVEALYIAYTLLGRHFAPIEEYHWKELFLERNRATLKLIDNNSMR
jgi:pre-rRNA-processing protein TSR3